MRIGIRYVHGWICVVLLLGLPVQAVEHVTAEYKPAGHEVGEAKFINKTPCSTRFPAFASIDIRCSTMDSVDIPRAISFPGSFSRKVLANTSIRDEAHYIGFPSAREVTLTKVDGSASYKIKFILTAVGAQVLAVEYDMGSSGISLTETGDCNTSTVWSSSPNGGFYFYYREIKAAKQQAGGACYGKGPKQLYNRRISSLFGYLGYKLETPNPLTIENGTYTGKLVLPISGSTNALDFGAGTNSPQGDLIFQFTFIVKHPLKVVFPPGGDKVVLQPPGGWSDWIYRGGKNQPSYLTATLPYRISINSNINVWLDCQYPDGEHCMLMNTRNGHKVRFYVMHRNRRMEDIALSAKVKLKLLMTDSPVVNEQRSIIFRVDKPALQEMMKHPGSTYKGDVTLIYDAAI